jgi:lipopolysaccharide transport protein LptA
VEKPSKVNRASRIVAAGLVAFALALPAWAQEGVGTGTVGDSIRNTPANPAPASASAPQPATSEESGDDSISVTGGVPGAPPAAAPSDTTQAQPAVAAPAEAAAPAVTIAPPEAPAPPAPPAVAVAPAPAPPTAPDVPVTAADAAPARASVAVAPIEPLPAAAAPALAAPAIASAPAPPAVASAPAPVAPDSTPVTTAATVPPGATAPPMVMAPVAPDAANPEPPSAPAAATSPAVASASAAEAAPHKAHKTASGAASGTDTKLASNPPDQGAFGGMQFGNSKAPINIKSNSMSLDYQNHSVLWIGNVHAVQADAQLTSDQLRVNYFDKDFKQMKDMVADGNVRLSQGTRWATGKHGVMDQTKRTVILTGSPVAHDGNDQITGCKITVYLNTSQCVVDCAHAVLFPHSDASPGANPGPAATAEQ